MLQAYTHLTFVLQYDSVTPFLFVILIICAGNAVGGAGVPAGVFPIIIKLGDELHEQ